MAPKRESRDIPHHIPSTPWCLHSSHASPCAVPEISHAPTTTTTGPLHTLFPVSACVCAQLLNCIQLFVTLWTVACQAPLSMEFSRQEYWSRLPFPPPRDLPDPKIEPTSPLSPVLRADALLLNHQGSPEEYHVLFVWISALYAAASHHSVCDSGLIASYTMKAGRGPFCLFVYPGDSGTYHRG